MPCIIFRDKSNRSLIPALFDLHALALCLHCLSTNPTLREQAIKSSSSTQSYVFPRTEREPFQTLLKGSCEIEF